MKPLTNKQREILKLVIQGNIDKTGARVSNIDYHQMLNRLPYHTSRDSLMCSISILESQGWLIKSGKELRDGRMKQTLEPTPVAIRVVSPAPATTSPVLVEIDLGDDIVELVSL